MSVEEERLAKAEERQQYRAPKQEVAAQMELLGEARANRDQGGQQHKGGHAGCNLHVCCEGSGEQPTNQRDQKKVEQTRHAVDRRLARVPSQPVTC